MSDTLDILKILALQVRNASSAGENTAERIGRTLIGIIENLSQSNIESLKELFLSKKNADQAAEIIDFLKGLTVNGDKASIDKDGNATVQQLIALVKAQVAALEVTGNAKTNSLDVTETATAKDLEVSNSVTTLNAVIQALAKTHDLTVENTADIMNGIIRQYLTSESFVSGFLGSGFKIWKDEQGLWHGELDELTVRKTFLVFELVVQKIVHQGGMVIRSAAGGKLKKVTDGGTYWKCEHDSTDDFVVGDQVLCQTFTGTSMKRYWRLVTSAGAGYFNLSKSDCEEGSANPEAGDEVAVLGNRTVTARQKAQIDCAVGDDAPYRDDYSGINSYSLVRKLVCRSGNCSGIVDEVFGALDETVNFYGKGVRLRGSFALESSGKLVENEISGQISNVRTELEVTAGQISSKVTEATVAATNAGNSATLAQGYASTAGQKASAAAGSATDAANILTVVTQKETSIQQTAQAIELKAVRAESAAGRAESAEASINLKADGIVLQASNQAAKSAVDGIGKLYVRGTGLNHDARPSVILNNVERMNSWSRGHNLTIIRRSDLAILAQAGYDTYADGSATNNLASYLNSLQDDVIVILVSYDACGTNQNLIAATQRCGGSGRSFETYRVPYAFIGIPTIGIGNGIEIICGTTSSDPYAEYSTTITNGIPEGMLGYGSTFTSKTEFSSQLTILNNSISTKVSQTDFNSLGTTVSSHTSTLSQLPTTIDARITTQVSSGGSIYTAVASSFSLSGNGISLFGKTIQITGATIFSSLATQSQAQDYAKTAVDGVQVGGRNLCPNTGFSGDSKQYWTWWSSAANGTSVVVSESTALSGKAIQYTWTVAGASGPYYSAPSFVPGHLKTGIQYTVSCWIKCSVSIGMDFGLEGSATYGKNVAANTWTYFSITFTYNGASNSAIHMYISTNVAVGTTVAIHSLKLEQGNKATDWTPAPEDVAQDATDKALAAQSNAISAASTDATTKVNASQTALATQLGYSSYAEMTAQAAAGKTIINGGYINTSLINANAIITNELLATKIAATDITTRRLKVGEGCTVGDFSIGSGRIGISTSPDGIGDSGMFLYADMIGFNSTITLSGGQRSSRQAIVGTYSVLGYPRLGQFIDTTSNYMPNVGLVFDINSTNNGGRNYAFVGRGNGVLNGFMCGYAFQELSFTKANQWQEISKLTSVVGIYGNYNNWAVVLPTFASVCNALNIGYNTPFVFQITVLCTSAVDSGKLYGRSNSGISGISGYEYPELHDWNNGIDNGGYVMGAGDSFQIVLFGQNNGTSSIPVASGSYRAYIVNKLS